MIMNFRAIVAIVLVTVACSVRAADVGKCTEGNVSLVEGELWRLTCFLNSTDVSLDLWQNGIPHSLCKRNKCDSYITRSQVCQLDNPEAKYIFVYEIEHASINDGGYYRVQQFITNDRASDVCVAEVSVNKADENYKTGKPSKEIDPKTRIQNSSPYMDADVESSQEYPTGYYLLWVCVIGLLFLLVQIFSIDISNSNTIGARCWALVSKILKSIKNKIQCCYGTNNDFSYSIPLVVAEQELDMAQLRWILLQINTNLGLSTGTRDTDIQNYPREKIVENIKKIYGSTTSTTTYIPIQEPTLKK